MATGHVSRWLLVLDVDGTLRGDTGILCPELVEYLKLKHAGGMRIYLASSRWHGILDPLRDELGFCSGLIGSGGAWTQEDSSLRVESHLSGVDPWFDIPWIQRFGALLEGWDLNPRVVAVVRGRQSNESLESVIRGGGWTKVVDVGRDEVPDCECIRVLVPMPRESTEPAPLAAFRVGSAVLEYYGRRRREFFDCAMAILRPEDANKGRAVRRVRMRHGVRIEHCVAVGDSGNDVAMFREVGHSLAVVGGEAEARNAAAAIVFSGQHLIEVLEDIVSCDNTAHI